MNLAGFLILMMVVAEEFKLFDCSLIKGKTTSTAKPSRTTSTLPTIEDPLEQVHSLVKLKEQLYDDCEDRKGCIAPGTAENQERCIEDRVCHVLAVYGGDPEKGVPLHEDEIVIELFGESERWIAMGFSEDNKMANDYVIECCVEVKGDVELYNSWNYPGRENKRQYYDKYSNGSAKIDPNSKTGQGPEGIIRKVNTKRDGSTLYCKFYIKNEFERKPKDLPNGKSYSYDLLLNEYHILMATGSNLIEAGRNNRGNLGQHDNYYTAGVHILGNKFEPTRTQIIILDVHGKLLVFVWFYFIPIGIFIGRYMKETNRDYVICGTRVWRFMHILPLSIAGILTIGSMVCQCLGRIGWYLLGKNSFHVTSGWLIDLSFLILVITGWKLTRDNPVEGIDWMQYIHGFLAHVSYIYGLFIIYYAPTSSSYARMPCSISSLTIGWIIIYFLMQIPITLHYCWLDYLYCNGWAGVSSSLFIFNTLTLRNNNESDAPGAKTRMCLSLIFILVTFIYGTIVVLIAFIDPPCRTF